MILYNKKTMDRPRLLPIRNIKKEENEIQHNISRSLIEDLFNIVDYDDDYYSHTTIMRPRLKLSLERPYITDFYNRYNRIIYNNMKNQLKQQILLSITERPFQYSMFCIDIDIKKTTNKVENLYNMDLVIDTIRRTNEYILLHNPIIERDILISVYLSKNPYMKNINTCSNGFHIQYPNLFINEDRRKKLQQVLKLGDTIYKNQWLLYGSVKNSTSGFYRVDTIYDYQLNEINETDFLRSYKIYNGGEKLYTPTKYQWTNILSIIPFNREITELNEIIIIEKRREIIEVDYIPVILRNETIQEIKLICNLLSISQSDNYKIWYIVGQTLYNLFNGSNDGLLIYKKFSKLSSKYHELETTNKYINLEVKGSFNIDTLINLTKYERHYKRLLIKKS